MPQQRVTFPIGEVLVTSSVQSAINDSGDSLNAYITRFQHGDWGDLTDHDKDAMDEAVRTGGKLEGSYQLRDNRTRIWISTNEQRLTTVIYLDQDR